VAKQLTELLMPAHYPCLPEGVSFWSKVPALTPIYAVGHASALELRVEVLILEAAQGVSLVEAM
jgi:hypothetical protein